MPLGREANLASYLIRRATTSDAEALANCLDAAFKPFRGEYSFAAYRDTVPTPSEMVRRLAEMCLFVAVAEGGEIVGTVGYRLIDAEEAHLRGMAVPPKYQGSGIAQRLLEAVESELRQTQCLRISLNTTPPLKRAASFYQKHGFQASGTVIDYFGMPLYEFTKTLTHTASEGKTV